MNILDPAILHYLNSLTPPRDSTLQQMERIAAEKRFPIIGPLVGRLLFQLALLTRARRIFELGSGYGYSAIWFARGLQPGGRIICTDGSRENAALAARFFKQADIEGLVDYRTGDALSLLAKEPGSFDIILNDVDKHEYPEVFRQAVPRLKKGGLLVTDNTLWQGTGGGRRQCPQHSGSSSLQSTGLPIQGSSDHPYSPQGWGGPEH